ncbi:MAG: response regulator [Ferruginibacter sp.]
MKSKKLFFLIDDDEDDQEIFSLAVKHADDSCECVCTDDCVDAIKKFAADISFMPHVIFIDMNMPRINGLECLREVRKSVHHKETPIYIYTTSSDEKIKQQSIEMGATGLIKKPSSLNDLVNLIAEVIDNPHSFAASVNGY